MFKDIVYLESHKRLTDSVEDLVAYHDEHKFIIDGPVMKKLGNPWYTYQPVQDFVWDKNFVERFPNFYKDVMSLPFDSIRRISFLESYKIVAPHQDMSRDSVELEPCAYRTFLANDETFYLTPCPDDLIDGKSKRIEDASVLDEFPKFFPNCELGRWWIMNNQNSIHGTIPQQLGSKKIIVSIWGKVNPERHMQFLEEAVKDNTSVLCWNK